MYVMQAPGEGEGEEPAAESSSRSITGWLRSKAESAASGCLDLALGQLEVNGRCPGACEGEACGVGSGQRRNSIGGGMPAHRWRLCAHMWGAPRAAHTLVRSAH
jgi:hypothetical protein